MSSVWRIKGLPPCYSGNPLIFTERQGQSTAWKHRGSDGYRLYLLTQDAVTARHMSAHLAMLYSMRFTYRCGGITSVSCDAGGLWMTTLRHPGHDCGSMGTGEG